MRYFRFFILLIVFFAIVIYLTSSGTEEHNSKNKALDNGVNFEGNVSEISQSNNHAFGIITLNLTKSSVQNFNKILNEGIYPYKIKGSVAELYTIIPDGIEIGDSVTLRSSEKNSHYYYVKSKRKSRGYIWIITEPIDISFVRKNTIFK